MRRFGISIYGVSRKIRTGELTPVRAFERICEMGAEVVELVPFGFNLVETPELRGDFKAASARMGVPIGNYSLNANFLMLSDEAYANEIARVKKHIDICSKCHPFYTGKQKFVDAGGRVDKFKKRLAMVK